MIALFTRAADGTLHPSAHAVGPWDPGQLHGGAPAALLAGAVQRLAPDMQIARLAYAFLGPVPLAPLTLRAELTRPGRRFQLAEAVVTAADGRPAMSVQATLLRRGEVALPEGATWPRELPGEGPEASRTLAFPVRAEEPRGMASTGMELRFADGTCYGTGHARTWFRLGGALVAGEPLLPVERVAAASDFPNGVAAVLSFATHLFVNVDLTVSLLRDPTGEWVLLDAATRIEPSGIGWASATLFDTAGPIGQCQQSLFVSER